MGAWGTGSFDNDDAGDFIQDIVGGGDLSLIHEVVDNVLTSTEYVEGPDASQVIAAAEVLAAALGRATRAAQGDAALMRWLARLRPSVETGLVARTAAALSRILASNSELRELWEDSDDFAEWRASVEELKSQLEAR
jgi:hypothetical protein